MRSMRFSNLVLGLLLRILSSIMRSVFLSALIFGNAFWPSGGISPRSFRSYHFKYTFLNNALDLSSAIDRHLNAQSPQTFISTALRGLPRLIRWSYTSSLSTPLASSRNLGRLGGHAMRCSTICFTPFFTVD